MSEANEKKTGQRREQVQHEKETEKEKITEAEIKLAWRMLKKKKAAGIDEISNKIWIYGGEGSSNTLIDMGRTGVTRGLENGNYCTTV